MRTAHEPRVRYNLGNKPEDVYKTFCKIQTLYVSPLCRFSYTSFTGVYQPPELPKEGSLRSWRLVTPLWGTDFTNKLYEDVVVNQELLKTKPS